ncbi:MAG: peptidoglycan DD-metalloendopeptidase family protein [Methylobacteriaceae bacterium]|nr:peptidoglycan DD-metalloendopeptidase family protein [Methylobacteriaceae bacterium]MBV9633282.1 peptidoglycan DD-metalloendopeptidase family protein [Methylobacteriaceae bacterium]MBV9704315.1 peptidoglycan DD-metalloendopeptidase family protein [Methylobacteriaceae bacterium]
MRAPSNQAKTYVGARLCLAVGLLTLPIAARPENSKPPQDPPAAPASGPQVELRGVEDTMQASQEQRRKLEAEIETMRADRARLNAALIETTGNVQATETKIVEVEKRLDTLTGSEDAIRRSLESRRDVIAEVLAALQRMGRKPPPAVLVRPNDMLEAVRTSMLLGAVVPELRAETEALATDLGELVRLRQAIIADRTMLQANLGTLAAERQRLAALVEARQGSLASAEKALDVERQRAADLARQAASLKELIARMESESSPAARAAEEARKAEAAQRHAAEAESDDVKARIAAAPFKDPARLAPQIAFVDTKGLLPLPAAGTLLKAFGDPDAFGGSERGLSLATRPSAIVSSPTDGWVVFAGPYRTYGELLIINAGGGYYVVLAGMDRINVDVGQFVLVGEPVAAMGDGTAKTAAAIAIGSAGPILYVEFRKDGAAIDPGPWWAKADMEKVRG